MKYDEELVKQLINPHGYLYFPDSSIHSYLDGIADDAYHKNEADGYIAALSIWHQLSEEILRVLYRYSQLLIKASLYPVKLDEKEIIPISMGALIEVNKQCVVYNRKSIILTNSKKLNNLRNDIFHHIIKHPTENEIIQKVIVAKTYYDTIFKEWREAMHWFYKEFDRIKKRAEISKLIMNFSKKGK